MSKVVMIWLDAFSSTYVDPQKTPFISELCRSGLYTDLKSLFAFSGIGVSAFTGIAVNTHKVWCDCVLRESKPPSAAFAKSLSLCGKLPDDTLEAYARNIVCRIFGYNPGIPNQIPVELVNLFETKEKERLTNKNPVPGSVTLFDQLRQCEVKYFVVGFYESLLEKLIVSRALRALDKDYRFILFHLGSLDRLGHKFGPESPEIRKRLGELDELVKKVMQKGIDLNPSTHFIIFSDHGMVPVERQINLMDALERLPIKMGEDYILFLNSTVANFWFKSQKGKSLIVEALGKIEPGAILDRAKLKELKIDKVGAEYGELFFALKEGNVFFPDFYRRRKPPKGMHGYAFSTYDNPPFVIYSPDISAKLNQGSEAEFIDVMPTILDLLNLPIPPSCEGKSLLKSD
ncbi:alkaline phosphatase family protein [Chloroflexota bacterium]